MNSNNCNVDCGISAVKTGSEQVNHPAHYQSKARGLNIEALDCMRAAFGDSDVLSFCLCNALKYIYRCRAKGRSQSVRKAIWYLNKYLELNKE